MDDQIEHAIGQENLLRLLRPRVRLQLRAGGGVQLADRAEQAESDVHRVVNGDQATRRLGRTALERPQLVRPLRDLLLPQHHAVEGVAGHDVPVRIPEDRSTRASVDNIEDLAPRAHDGWDARSPVVMTRIPRTSLPLQMPDGGGDGGVLAHRVVVRPAQVVRPVVQLLREGLDRPLPPAGAADQQHAVRREHPHQLRLRDLEPRTHDQQVHHVVDVRQMLAVERRSRDLAAQPRRQETLPGRPHPGRVGVQPVDDEGVGPSQRFRERARLP